MTNRRSAQGLSFRGGKARSPLRAGILPESPDLANRLRSICAYFFIQVKDPKWLHANAGGKADMKSVMARHP